MKFKTLLIAETTDETAEEITELTNRGLSLVVVQYLDDALQHLEEDGSIQTVLTEWKVRRKPQSRSRRSQIDEEWEESESEEEAEISEDEIIEEPTTAVFEDNEKSNSDPPSPSSSATPAPSASSSIQPRSVVRKTLRITTRKKFLQGVQLFKRLKRERPEIDLFLYTLRWKAPDLQADGYLSGYFCKSDRDYDDVARKVKAEFMENKAAAPFFEALQRYEGKTKDSFHTPGHSSGYSVKTSPFCRDFYDFFGPNLFSVDVSCSVPELDSLLHPHGVIQQAQELAARAFGSRFSFFCTNGTSTANKIVVQTLVRPGQYVLVDRNCHKSIHHAMVIVGAIPIYLTPSVNERYGIFGPVPKASIFAALDRALAQKKRVPLLILTYCTYDGMIYGALPEIVAYCHSRGVKVFADEAWYGHGRFHHALPSSALEAGADYATQSTHKVMSAFSQASIIHVQDPDFEAQGICHFFREVFNMHTSTSPAYPLMASLDVARKQMVVEGYSLLSRLLELAEYARKSINTKLTKFHALQLADLVPAEVAHDGIQLDPTKLTIDFSQSGLSSQAIEHILLSQYGLQIEKTTFNTISVLLTIGTTYSKFNRFFLALQSIDHIHSHDHLLSAFSLSSSSLPLTDSGLLATPQQGADAKAFPALVFSPLVYPPQEAFYARTNRIELVKSIHRISSGLVVPYPPGIPLLVPGQLITAEIIAYLETKSENGVEIHGLINGLISVVSLKDEKRLTDAGLKLES